MRHRISARKFNRDTNARKALFIGLVKNLVEKEQIKTTLPKAKDLRGIIERMITRAKVDTVANRRLISSKLDNSSNKTVKKLFEILGPRYLKRPGGYTRVLKAGFRYGDAAPMAIIELVDRDENAKKVIVDKTENKTEKMVDDKKSITTDNKKVVKEIKATKAVSVKKEATVRRRATGK